MDEGDTIAAIATAPGPSGLAVVRVSGPGAFDIAAKLTGRAAVPGEMSLRKVRCPGAGMVDRSVLLAFKAPRSYTGEDVVEFQCHGGSVTPRRVLEAAFAAGARLARRGEFTERALLNGKIDYDQAESVLALVNAKTARAADSALEGVLGRRSRESRSLYDAALDVSTRLEHALDVSEDELPASFFDDIRSRLSALDGELSAGIARMREGRILRDGAMVVLAGPPNVGKSSLMNALLDENRAIVSATPGTTRDSIEELIDVRGWPARLVDTAGLRETADEIEAEGVRRSEALVEAADVVLRLEEATGARCAAGGERRSHEIRVFTKCDLLPEPPPARSDAVFTSAATGGGLDDLKDAIASELEALSAVGGDVAADRGERALSVFMEAREKVRAALGAISECDADLVLLANEMRDMAGRLGSLVGAEYSSDLLENLFSRFCVGK